MWIYLGILKEICSFMFMHLSVCMCTMYVALGNQERVSHPLELGFQAGCELPDKSIGN